MRTPPPPSHVRLKCFCGLTVGEHDADNRNEKRYGLPINAKRTHTSTVQDLTTERGENNLRRPPLGAQKGNRASLLSRNQAKSRVHHQRKVRAVRKTVQRGKCTFAHHFFDLYMRMLLPISITHGMPLLHNTVHRQDVCSCILT